MSKSNLKANEIASDFITDPRTKEEIHVSTVSLFMPNLGRNYETVIFGGKLNLCQARYITLEQAHEGHKQATALVYESFKE